MSATNTITGRNGKIVFGGGTLILRVKNWSITPSAGGSEWGDSGISSTDPDIGYKHRRRGIRDLTGSFEIVLDKSAPIYASLREGGEVMLDLWQTTVAADNWHFPIAVILGGPNITTDMDTEEVTEVAYDFGNDGVYYAPGEVGAPAQSIP